MMYEMLRLLMTYLSTVLILTSLGLFCPQKVPVNGLAKPIQEPLLAESAQQALTYKTPLLSSLGSSELKWSESSVLYVPSTFGNKQTLLLQEPKVMAVGQTKQLPRSSASPASEWFGRTAELDCVSQMVWGESRNQPYAGMVATAASAINRSKSGLYSRNLCAVVRSPGQYKGYWGAPKPVRNRAWAEIYQAVVAASYHRDKLPVAYRQIMYFSTGQSDFHSKKQVVMKIGDHVYVK